MRKILLSTIASIASSLALGAVANAQSLTPTDVAPGTVVVRLNGHVNWYIGTEGSSADHINGTKTSTVSSFGYLRLYPAVDGVTTSGVHYGAAAEIRENIAASPGTDTSTNTLYAFQAYSYLGLPSLGQLSFGQQNGPVVLFMTGNFENFNDGGWAGDIPVLIPSAARPAYPFVNSNFDQTTNKIVYVSPNFNGFQFGIGFTPNQVLASYTQPITSTNSPVFESSGGQPKNLIDVGGQMTRQLGAVAVQVGADYQYASRVNYTGSMAAVNGLSYRKHLGIFSGGATATIAGFSVGGNLVYGAFNGGAGTGAFQLVPNGGSDAIGYLLGAEYTYGPFVVGSHFFHFNTTGALPGGVDSGSSVGMTSQGLTSGQQVNYGFASGATYNLAPQVKLYVDYLYGWRRQGGYDFLTGDAGTQHNRVQSQLIGLGTQLQW